MIATCVDSDVRQERAQVIFRIGAESYGFGLQFWFQYIYIHNRLFDYFGHELLLLALIHTLKYLGTEGLTCLSILTYPLTHLFARSLTADWSRSCSTWTVEWTA